VGRIPSRKVRYSTILDLFQLCVWVYVCMSRSVVIASVVKERNEESSGWNSAVIHFFFSKDEWENKTYRICHFEIWKYRPYLTECRFKCDLNMAKNVNIR
jgi:hypothetical protein